MFGLQPTAVSLNNSMLGLMVITLVLFAMNNNYLHVMGGGSVLTGDTFPGDRSGRISRVKPNSHKRNISKTIHV